jgi:hypothetical protein
MERSHEVTNLGGGRMTQMAVRRGPVARLGIALAAALALVTAGTPALSRPATTSNDQPVSVLVRAIAPASGLAERAVAAVGGTVTEELPIVGGFAAKVPPKAVAAQRSLPCVLLDVNHAGQNHF